MMIVTYSKYSKYSLFSRGGGGGGFNYCVGGACRVIVSGFILCSLYCQRSIHKVKMLLYNSDGVI